MKAPDWVRKRVKHEMTMLHMAPVDGELNSIPLKIEFLRRCIPDGSPRCSLMKGYLEVLQSHYLLCEVFGYPIEGWTLGFKVAMDAANWDRPWKDDRAESVGSKTDKVMSFVESIYALTHPIRGHEQTFRSTDLHRNTYPE